MSTPLYELLPQYLPAVLELNQQYTTEMSSLTLGQLARMVDIAAYARGTANLDGFLLALDQSAAHDGDNFNWMKARYPHFLYVDRLAVAAHAQGRGIARLLYRDVIAWGTQRGYPVITCEVNVRPPNPASDALHASLGFAEIGQQELGNGKLVRYLARAGGSQ